MSFSEQESVTIKRLEVAIRNSDMELLKDASYKLHEKLHEGYRFEMLQELSQILAYVSDSDIPADIKEILCPTIEEILDKETAPPSNAGVIESSVESTVQDYTSPSQTSLGIDIPQSVQRVSEYEQENKYYGENSTPENPNVYVEKTNENEVNSYNQYQNEPVVEIPQVVQENLFEQPSESHAANQEKDIEIYEPAYSNEIQNEVNNTTEENNMQDEINTYQEQFGSSSGYDLNIGGYSTEQIVNNIQEEVKPVEEVVNNIEDDVEKNYKNEITEDEPQHQTNEKHLENMAVFYYDKKSTPISSSTNQIDELSSIIDKIDTDVYDFEKFLKLINEINYKTKIVTTTQSIKLSEFLVQENISFSIPFVTNTSGESSDIEIIPMYGLSNIFKCQNCGSKILSYSFNNKVLSVKCSNCSDVMYPEIYADDANINPYYWQRAFGALSGSETWVLMNLPSDEGVIKDFIRTVYKNSKPKRIYLFPENNYYEDFFSKTNPNCEIITYQTQEKMIADLSYGENVMQALI